MVDQPSYAVAEADQRAAPPRRRIVTVCPVVAFDQRLGRKGRRRLARKRVKPAAAGRLFVPERLTGRIAALAERLVTRLEDADFNLSIASPETRTGIVMVRHDRPAEARASRPEPTPKPLFHAFTRRAWHEMHEALSLILAAYRDAAKRLKRGNLSVDFPENTFPPARSFIEPVWSMAIGSLKTPAPELLQPG